MTIYGCTTTLISGECELTEKKRTVANFLLLYLLRSHSYQIGTAFEVHVRSQSLCTSDEDPREGAAGSSSAVVAETTAASQKTTTAASLHSGAAAITNQRNLWTTKEAGACVLTALLLRLEPVN